MYLRCALCKYGINRRGVIVCAYYGSDKQRTCTRFVPKDHMLIAIT